jgi:hydroxymethylbilane synthase
VRFRLGTRGSRLALEQAGEVARALEAPGVEVEIVALSTSGDRKRDWDRSEKGIFVAEIDQALRRQEIDLAVHSMKDIPTQLPADLEIACVPARLSPFDVVLPAGGLKTLDAGSRIGTSSIRRKAEIARARPDLEVVELRGNVDSRLEKLGRGELQGLLLAEAGMRRLRIEPARYERLPAEVSVPAAGQGALGIAVGADAGSDVARALRSALRHLDHPPTRTEVEAERAFIAEMGAGCHSPVGALGRAAEDGTLSIYAGIGGTEKRVLVHGRGATLEQAQGLGRAAAKEIRSSGTEPR